MPCKTAAFPFKAVSSLLIFVFRTPNAYLKSAMKNFCFLFAA